MSKKREEDKTYDPEEEEEDLSEEIKIECEVEEELSDLDENMDQQETNARSAFELEPSSQGWPDELTTEFSITEIGENRKQEIEINALYKAYRDSEDDSNITHPKQIIITVN